MPRPARTKAAPARPSDVPRAWSTGVALVVEHGGLLKKR
jgi:hypothetical protein